MGEVQIQIGDNHQPVGFESTSVDRSSHPLGQDLRMIGSNSWNIIDALGERYLAGEQAWSRFTGFRDGKDVDEIISTADIEAAGGIDQYYEERFGYNRADFFMRRELQGAAMAAQDELDDFEKTHAALREVPKLIEDSRDLIKDGEIDDAETLSHLYGNTTAPSATPANDAWALHLRDRAKGVYHGMDSHSAIKLMRAHAEGADPETMRELFRSEHYTGFARIAVLYLIKTYYKDGDDLCAIVEDIW